MKKIIVSIKPQWTAKILNGEKTLEIRKSAPKDLPCEVYIYCTKGKPHLVKHCFDGKYHAGDCLGTYDGVANNEPLNGKVVAKFTLNKVDKIENDRLWQIEKGFLECACLSFGELAYYLGGKTDYAWHIDNLVIFDEPKELKEFEYTNPSGIRNIGQRSIKGLPSKKHPPQSWCYCEVDE